MEPIDFPQANRTFIRPTGVPIEECGDLRVFDNGEAFISCWRPSTEELGLLLAGKPVYLWIRSRIHPQVAITMDEPT